MHRSLKILYVALLFLCGCGPNESILRSNSNSGQAASPRQTDSQTYDSADSEVENMRTADFDFILVLRRRDGAKMQQDDKAFIRTNMSGANRRSLVDDEKTIVIGSNARVPPELMTRLNDRFDVQDFSKPESEIPASPSPANANMVH